MQRVTSIDTLTEQMRSADEGSTILYEVGSRLHRSNAQTDTRWHAVRELQTRLAYQQLDAWASGAEYACCDLLKERVAQGGSSDIRRLHVDTGCTE